MIIGTEVVNGKEQYVHDTDAEAIQYHMKHARACRAVLDRIRDTDHERRRATVRTMKEHVAQARAHSRAIIATRKGTTT